MKDLLACGADSYLDAALVNSVFDVSSVLDPPGRPALFWRHNNYLLLAGVRRLALAAGDSCPTMGAVVDLARDRDALHMLAGRGLQALDVSDSPVDRALLVQLRAWFGDWVRMDERVRTVLLDSLDVGGRGFGTRRRDAADQAGFVLLRDRQSSWADYDVTFLSQNAQAVLAAAQVRLAEHQVRPVDESPPELGRSIALAGPFLAASVAPAG